MDKKDDNYFKKIWIMEVAFLVIGACIILLTKIGIFEMMPNCFFRECLGIICPFCGGTRAVTNLISFNFVKAFLYHPAVIIYLFVLFIGNCILVYDTLKHRVSRITLNLFLKSFFIFIIITIIQYFIRLYFINKGIDFGLF